MASKSVAKMWRVGRRPRTASALVGALALSMMASASPALAQEDAGPSFGQNILRTLMGGGAARPDINYRERSPLVIPPARALPAPAARSASQGNPAWPNDPDKQAGGSDGGPRSAQASAEREARSLSPTELRRGARARGGGGQRPHVAADDNETGRALRPHEMNAPTVSQAFGTALGGSKEKTVTFAGEPTRTRMTDPPAGYRTPAPSQPYTPPKGTGAFKIPSFFDRGTDPNQ